jgi:hypothetical protein
MLSVFGTCCCNRMLKRVVAIECFPFSARVVAIECFAFRVFLVRGDITVPALAIWGLGLGIGNLRGSKTLRRSRTGDLDFSRV